MELSIKIEIPEKQIFSHINSFFVIGSCFAENIGFNLVKYLFKGECNPFGILFNPASIVECLNRILNKKFFTKDEFFFYNNLWHSDLCHGLYSNNNADFMLKNLNKNLLNSNKLLENADFLIITFGSSWVWEKDGKIVANCHKLPENMFVRRRLSVEEIVFAYKSFLSKILKINAKLKIIFSVSPIRYLRDGIFDNSTNKATLLLATEQIIKIFPQNTIYFPAYEIMLDELRDYRFYADDMLHPSELAKKIIWQRFANAFFTEKTLKILTEIENMYKFKEHKSLHYTDKDEQNRQKKIEKMQKTINDLLT